MPAWVNVAGVHASVVWQAPQLSSDAMCAGDLPVAVVPLWHDTQVPTTWVWSTVVAGFQALVPWHDSHVEVL